MFVKKSSVKGFVLALIIATVITIVAMSSGRVMNPVAEAQQAAKIDSASLTAKLPQEWCGTEAAMAKLSRQQRDDLRRNSITPLFAQSELLLYLHFASATIIPGLPDANGFRSTIVNQTRNTPAPNLTAEQIAQTIELVKDDFSPFNIRITTDYDEFLNYPLTNKQISIVTTVPSVLGLPPDKGGVSPFSVIGTRHFANPSFTFASQVGNIPVDVANIISHEVGHSLGLAHQSQFDSKCGFILEYHPTIGVGPIAFGPIMGSALTPSISNWWSQECLHPTNGGPLKDFELIGDQVVLRGDDFPNSTPGGTATLPVLGTLERAGDADLIRVTSNTASIFSVQSSNIDIVASVFLTDGTLVGRFNDPDRPGVSFPVTSGVREIRIRAAANSNLDPIFMTGRYLMNSVGDDGSISYTAIGDSLAFGTGAANPSVGGYVPRFRDKLQLVTGQSISVQNFGVFGQFSGQLLSELQSNATIRTSLQNADVITLNIGGNDLGLARLQYRNNTCGGLDGQDCLRSAANSLKLNWNTIVSEIRTLNHSADVRTIDIYYPAVDFDSTQDSFPDDGGLNDFQVLTIYLNDVNTHISGNAGSNHIKRGHVRDAFNGAGGNTDPNAAGLLSGDLTHPNDTGHELIATLLMNENQISFGIDPEAITILFGTEQNFEPTGGTAPYTFSLVQNQSGGNIDQISGVYTAGATVGMDIIRIVDSLSASADATVIVSSDIACPDANTRIWDGGGTTNNWSDPLNWCNNTVPVNGNSIVFDGTSTNDATVDVNLVLGNSTLNMNAGYTGTVSMAPGINAEFNNTTISSGTFTANDGTVSFPSVAVTLAGGTYNAGSGLTHIHVLIQNSGTFIGSTGLMTSNGININGGSFVAPIGTLRLGGSFALNGGTFNNNNGTIEAINTLGNTTFAGTSVHNLIINKDDDTGVGFSGTTTVNGLLTLNEGLINAGTLRVIGSIAIAPTFGNAGQGGGGGDLFFDDDAQSKAREIDFPAGVRLPNLRINDPDIVISSSGSGTINVDDLQLDSGVIDIVSNNLIVGYNPIVAGSPITINGGSFSMNSGNLTMNSGSGITLNNGTFSMVSGNVLFGSICQINGGTFNAPTGTMTISSGLSGFYAQSGGIFNGNGPLDINGSFTLTGGTFNASTTTTNFGFQFTRSGGGTFNHNGGTAIFDSSHPAYGMIVNTNGGVETFNNIMFDPTTDNAQVSFNFQTFRANGSLQILNGRMNAGNFEVAGDVTIGAGADGDNVQMTFIGTNNQTFTNNGGLNTTGTMTINKPSGTVTAATDLLLATNQTLNVTSGTLYLANGSDLTVGPVNVAAQGRLINDSSTTITLGGNVSNLGNIFLLGGGAACPQSDTVLIRSSVNGTQRNWSGNGSFAIADADIQDMSGTAPITAYSSTDSGNNGANWTFDPACSPALSISPQNISVNPGQTQVFAASGGYGAKTFSLPSNNSGATINQMNGSYTAGPATLVTDIVRVTDALGFSVETNVTVNPPTVVTNTNDGGFGSLRQAIENSNIAPGIQTISFNIPGQAPHKITLTSSELPTIVQPVIIDATTQPGYSGTPVIELDGSALGSGSGLFITAGNTLVKGLAIISFSNEGSFAIVIFGGGGNVIQGNNIGVDATGDAARPNFNGILVQSNNNTIGGSAPADRNIISGNSKNGLLANSNFNIVKGNFIGTNAAGNVAIGNEFGVSIDGSGNSIGGALPNEGNVISGNGDFLNGFGLQVRGSENTVLGNKIGSDVTGNSALPNSLGVSIQGGSRTMVGGVETGQRNIIAFNSTQGIRITGNEKGNTVRGNSNHSNGALGIDLGTKGVNANDKCDSDGGPNEGQNFPVLTSVSVDGSETVFTGVLSTEAGGVYTIDLYSCPTCDSSGYGEAQTYLGSTTVAAGPSCDGSDTEFSVTLPVVLSVGDQITATATNQFGSTSELSACFGPTAAIGGTILDQASNQPIPNIQVKLVEFTSPLLPPPTPDNRIERTTITGKDGTFVFTGLPLGRNFTVTPVASGDFNGFSPTSRTYTDLQTTQSDGYTAGANGKRISVRTLLTYAIPAAVPGKTDLSSQDITNVNSGPVGLSGVLVTITDENGVVSSGVTGKKSSGYSSPILPSGTYTITPSKANYTFIPASRVVTLPQDPAEIVFLSTSPGLDGLPGRFVFNTTYGASIRTMNANGSGLVTLRSASSSSGYFSPSFSDDGESILFTRSELGNHSLRSMLNDGDGDTEYSTSNVKQRNARFSPAGNKIAYDRNNGIYVLDVLTAQNNLIASNCVNPDWSPDGTQLVYSCNGLVTKSNIDGSDQTILSNGPTFALSPKWFANGSKIGYIRRSATGTQYTIATINSDGSGIPAVIGTWNGDLVRNLMVSPDGLWFGFIRVPGGALHSNLLPPVENSQVTVIGIDGTTELEVTTLSNVGDMDWGSVDALPTPAGTNVNIQPPSGNVSINLPVVSTGGITIVLPVTEGSLGNLPVGYLFQPTLISLGEAALSPSGTEYKQTHGAYEIATSATLGGLANACFKLPSNVNANMFNSTELWHFENGVFIDVTTTRNFGSKEICGQVTSFSPFAFATQIDPALPNITGLVVDLNGAPLSDIPVRLSGDEDRETYSDNDGIFRFVNLSQGGSYTVDVFEPGMVFEPGYQTYSSISGDNVSVFVADPSDVAISGTVRSSAFAGVPGVRVLLNGSVDSERITDVNGYYSFESLPANGIFNVIPYMPGVAFAPSRFDADLLQQELSNIDFTQFAPTSASVTVSGRVMRADGQGIPRALVTFTDSSGSIRTALTNPFGYYSVEGLRAGESYVATAKHKGFEFAPQVVTLVDSIEGFNFTPLGGKSDRPLP